MSWLYDIVPAYIYTNAVSSSERVKSSMTIIGFNYVILDVFSQNKKILDDHNVHQMLNIHISPSEGGII